MFARPNPRPKRDWRVARWPDNELFPVPSTLGPVLLLLNDPAADAPIGTSKQCVHHPGRRVPRCFDEHYDVREHGVVVGCGSRYSGFLTSHWESTLHRG